MGLLGVGRMRFSNTAPGVQQELLQGVWAFTNPETGSLLLWGPATLGARHSGACYGHFGCLQVDCAGPSVYAYCELQPLGSVWVCGIDCMLLHVAPLLLCWSRGAAGHTFIAIAETPKHGCTF
jgi:hypothetical protein